MQARQGDIYFEAIPEIPTDAKKVKARGRYIIAEGEATGHHHSVAVMPDVEMFERAGTLYLRVQRDDVKVEHQEHGPIDLPSGTYRVTRQREYHPEAIRQVAD